jgi:hypothetical protein
VGAIRGVGGEQGHLLGLRWRVRSTVTGEVESHSIVRGVGGEWGHLQCCQLLVK